MTEAVVKPVISPEGHIELELVDAQPGDQKAFAALISRSDEIRLRFFESENGGLQVQRMLSPDQLEAERAESEAWLRAMAAGGSFDFWDNEIDDAVWNNA